MALLVQRFFDDGYGLILALDTGTLDLEGVRARYDRARAAAEATDDPYFEMVLRVPDHVAIWAYDPATLDRVRPRPDEDYEIRQLLDAPWDGWEICDAQPEVLLDIERHSGFRWGSIKLEVDSSDVYLRLCHKHAEGGLGVFNVDLDPRQFPEAS